MDKEVKQKYKTDFAVLKELVNSFDPCGLIKGGAPSDEYDCLTQQILSAIYSKKSRQEIRKLIIHEVDNHFEMPVEEKYKAKFNDSIDKFLIKVEQTFNSTNAQQ